MKHRLSLTVGIRLMLLVLLSLACTFSTGLQAATTLAPLPESVEPVFLDLCTLVTLEEAETILSGPVDVSHQGDGSCYYSAGYRQASISFLAISAAWGKEAKTYALEKLGLLKVVDTTPDLKELVENSPEMTLQEVVTQTMGRLQEVDGEVTPYDDLGDVAYGLVPSDQFFIPSELGKLRRLVVVQDGAYVQMTLAGENASKLDLALGQLVSLVPIALERLPPAFYVIPKVGEAFSPEKTHEPEAISETPTFVGLVGVTSPSTGQVFVIDPLTNQVVTVDVGGTPVDIVNDGAFGWVAGGEEGVVRMLNPFNRQVIDTISVGGSVLRLAMGQASSVWAAGDFGVQHIPFLVGDQLNVVDSSCYDVALGEDAVWATQSQDRQVLKLDLATGTVISTLKTEGQPTEIAYGLGFIWVLLSDAGQLVQIDPQANRVISTISISKTATALAVGLDRVWYTSETGIVYVKPGEQAGLISVSKPLGGIAVYAGSIWVTSPGEGLVLRIPPDAGGSDVLGEMVEIVTGGAPTAISAGP